MPRNTVLSLLLMILVISGCAHTSSREHPNKHAVPEKSSLMVVYFKYKSIVVDQRQSKAVRQYRKNIATLPLKSATLSALHSVADSVGWISAMKLGRYKKGASKGLDVKQYAALSNDDRYDSLVGVTPSLELTKGLGKVLLVATVWIQKDTIFGPTIIDRHVVTESISLEKAGPPLSENQLKLVRSDDPGVSASARAEIWFAHNGRRLRNAMLFDLSVFAQNLRKYLIGHGSR